jgi:Transglutaminase-like superfamily
MKTLFLYITLSVIFYQVKGQDQNISTDVVNVPESQTHSSGEIAAYISKNADNDEKKVRSAYMWVIRSITYDRGSSSMVILNENKSALIQSTLQKRKGVCENFAYLFADLCKKMGIPAYVVGGYTRQNGSVDKSSHAWCTVYLNHRWTLYDPTWDEGGFKYSGLSYFKVSPEVFIQSHMPFDPIFQLLDYPLTFDEFNRGKSSASVDTRYYNCEDSINAYSKMDSLDRYLSEERRIENNGTPNSTVETKIKQLKMEVEIINEDQDSKNYNEAVANYNEAVNLLNEFINYRNKQFKLSKTEEDINDLFDEINSHLDSARQQLKAVNQSKATLVLNTGDIEYALDNLEKQVTDEKNFYKSQKNLNTSP